MTYTFTNDFINAGPYVSNQSKLYVSQGIEYNQIFSSKSWREKYGRTHTYQYLFTFDPPDKTELLIREFTLIDVYEIEYPFNLHIKPVIYVYQRNTTLE